MDIDVRRPVPDPWDTSLRADSQSPDGHTASQRRGKRSPNRVKAKPANPAVISSIISSLDTLTSPTVPPSNESDSGSRHSRPLSSDGTIVSAASIRRSVLSPGFGVEYGNSIAFDDDEGLSDAALPPTIPTTRVPSRLSQYTASRSPAFHFPQGDDYIGVHSSRPSSISGSSVQSISKHKLSAESWVRKHATNEERGESYRAEAPRGRASGKSLRRKSSQEMLRSQITPPRGLNTEPRSVSLAEQIIARTPPPLSDSRGRLYLRDSTFIEDRLSAPSPPPIALRRSKERVLGFTQKSSLEDQYKDARADSVGKSSPEDKLTPARVSTLKSSSPISDSIPTRTSSLRQASSSPSSSRRKGKTSRRPEMTTSKSDFSSGKRSKTIPESTWADLGEDDETVKRIRELREQRKSRLDELTAYIAPVDVAVPQNEVNPSTNGASTANGNDGNSAPRPRSSANRNANDPSKALKRLGINDAELAVSGLDGTSTDGLSQHGAFNVSPRPNGAQRPFSAHHRPSTPRSDIMPTPSLSLDYSYADAVDALHSAERPVGTEKDVKPTRDASNKRASLFLRGIDILGAANTVPPPPRLDPKKLQKVKRDRWAAAHVDLAGDFEVKKDRRKSMSDTRNNRTLEEEVELMRKNSIEDAVLSFLQHPRLSRRVQNPITGRTLAFSEVGDPNGAVVFVCVGMGLTRYVTAFYDELAVTLRLRLITVDRPGVGGSEPYPSSDKSGPLGWPEDILAICEYLEISKFSLLAHSAGAVYALATALILPHMVKGKVHLLAPWIPPSQLEAISHPTASAPPAGALPRGQRLLRVLPTPFLKAANSSFMAASSASLKPAHKRKVQTPPRRSAELSQSPQRSKERPMSAEVRPEYSRRESMMLMDRFMPATIPSENFPIPVTHNEESEPALRRGSLILSATATPTDPSFTYASTALNAAEHAERERQVAYTSRLTELTWELATRDSNPATDLLICLERNRTVGFRYTDVSRQVVVTHGAEDKRVPLANVRWLAEQMNRRAAGVSSSPGEPASRDGWADASTAGGCEVRALPGEGHGLMANPIIMGDILTEISGYWNDRSRRAA